jgi:hypothetical protein
MGALNQSGGRSAVKTFKKRTRVDKTGVKGGTVSLGGGVLSKRSRNGYLTSISLSTDPYFTSTHSTEDRK